MIAWGCVGEMGLPWEDWERDGTAWGRVGEVMVLLEKRHHLKLDATCISRNYIIPLNVSLSLLHPLPSPVTVGHYLFLSIYVL